MTSKLSETFDMDDVPEELRDYIFKVEIPDDAELDDVAKLALEAYKMQMDTILLLEPKYRARGLEVAKQYLEIAMNSISKKRDLDQKEKRLMSKKGDELATETPKGVSRNMLLEELAKKRA